MPGAKPSSYRYYTIQQLCREGTIGGNDEEGKEKKKDSIPTYPDSSRLVINHFLRIQTKGRWLELEEIENSRIVCILKRLSQQTF